MYSGSMKSTIICFSCRDDEVLLFTNTSDREKKPLHDTVSILQNIETIFRLRTSQSYTLSST